MEYLELLNKYKLHIVITLLVVYVVYRRLNCRCDSLKSLFDLSGNSVKNE